jgi:hypothetical protein
VNILKEESKNNLKIINKRRRRRRKLSSRLDAYLQLYMKASMTLL